MSMTSVHIQRGTRFWWGPTWCSCSTKTVRMMDMDVMAIVTVR